MVFLFRRPRFVEAYAFRIKQGDVKENNLCKCFVLLPTAHLGRISMNNGAYIFICLIKLSARQMFPFSKVPPILLVVNLLAV